MLKRCRLQITMKPLSTVHNPSLISVYWGETCTCVWPMQGANAARPIPLPWMSFRVIQIPGTHTVETYLGQTSSNKNTATLTQVWYIIWHTLIRYSRENVQYNNYATLTCVTISSLGQHTQLYYPVYQYNFSYVLQFITLQLYQQFFKLY
ncbi:hypothetical protein BDD12DRAFT_983152 [Trichophaea hybrida]|nr:hypothetical protein BDD12DRAFT_983152 [Trichophaea hybrida]